ncbi:MAG: ExeM/NucH family extracellular endonuclease [Nocardioidaceae bacterium]
MNRPSIRRAWAASVGLALVAAPLVLVSPASASATGLVISEVYGGGGNSGAPYTNDFIELQNTTGSPISVAGMSVQYRSATGTASAATALSGTVPAHGKFLVAEAAGATPSTALPTPDATGTFAMSGTAGVIFLSSQATGVPANDASIVDLVGYGTTATAFEGTAAAPGLSNTTAATRTADGADSNDNKADLTSAGPKPENSSTSTPPAPGDPVAKTIEEIQGNGATSPLAQQSVITKGVVTAAYPTGGFSGYYLQTPGTGGAIDPSSHDTSDAVFVFAGSGATYPQVGDYLQVTGKVTEFNGMTELTPAAGGVSTLTDPVAAPAPATVGFPATDASRESLEGMLVAPQGAYTVTDNYSLNQYAEIGLAHDTLPLPQSTDVAKPGPAAQAVEADNAGKKVVLDDGSSVNYFTTGKDIPLPYLTGGPSIRVGAPATFTTPVILDFRNSAWKFQPTQQLTVANAGTVQPATFPDTRPAAPAPVGGQLKVASFNVLNFFTETGADFIADGGTCSFYDDRAGVHVTVNSCNGNGPRGAADDTNLDRQKAKIVAAINTLGADVLSLEEIENSAQYAGPDRRDDALSSLVDALNTAAGSTVWKLVPSPAPADRPAVSDEDVIRTAFIYKQAKVAPVGTSHILADPAFANAREPLAQSFRPAGGFSNQDFLVIVNHFKSKGSGVNDGTGQGNANPDRVAQAKALVTFADQQKKLAGTDTVFLTGDFNSYTQEDPLQVLYDAGYTDIGHAEAPAEYTYQFGGTVGSLDHVLANGTALDQVTGAHVWNINSVESVAYEYSRFNYNVTSFYAPNPYRSSDHDPLLVGFDVPAPPAATTTTASVAPEPVVVRYTKPTVTATVKSETGAVEAGTVTFSSGGTVLGTAPVSGGTASLQLPAYDAVGPQTVTASYGGSRTFSPSSADVAFDVVKATPVLTVAVQPDVIHKRTTQPRLDVALTAPGQVVTGYVVVRQNGSILAFEPLSAGRATITLPTYKQKGQETVSVEYLGSDLAEAVTKSVTFTVQN